MRAEVAKSDGVGLAAVQIGTPKRIILVLIDGSFRAFINPRTIRRSWKKIIIEEGCLSLPGKNGLVKRHYSVTISAVDERGNRVKEKFNGLPAVILQHEIDHLNGILFIDKLWKK